jgi:hypothetical protein
VRVRRILRPSVGCGLSAGHPFKRLRLLLSKARGTAHLFERLRCDRPEASDPRSGSLPALRRALLWMVGMRCARPWIPSLQRGLLPRRFTPFQKPPPSKARHLDLKNAVSRFEFRGFTGQGNDLFSADRDLISQFHELWRRLRMKPPPCMNHSLKGVISKSSLATISPVVVLRACISM